MLVHCSHCCKDRWGARVTSARSLKLPQGTNDFHACSTASRSPKTNFHRKQTQQIHKSLLVLIGRMRTSMNISACDKSCNDNRTKSFKPLPAMPEPPNTSSALSAMQHRCQNRGSGGLSSGSRVEVIMVESIKCVAQVSCELDTLPPNTSTCQGTASKQTTQCDNRQSATCSRAHVCGQYHNITRQCSIPWDTYVFGPI